MDSAAGWKRRARRGSPRRRRRAPATRAGSRLIVTLLVEKKILPASITFSWTRSFLASSARGAEKGSRLKSHQIRTGHSIRHLEQLFTYKGHGDDYAVVSSGLMAAGVLLGVVMQQAVRARTLVLHTPPSLQPSVSRPPPRSWEMQVRGVSLTTAASYVGCRLFPRSLRPELLLAPVLIPFPFLDPGSRCNASSCTTCHLMEEGQEVHLRTESGAAKCI